MLSPSAFLQYDALEAREDDAWKPIDHVQPAAGVSSVQTATVLSWNVWFAKVSQDLRYAALLSTVLDLSLGVDVACFQEVEDNFWEALQEHPVIRSDWLISDWAQQRRNIWYGTAIIVRKGWLAAAGSGGGARVAEHAYANTVLGRQLLVAQFGVLTVGTTHLESFPQDGPKRAGQLRAALACFDAGTGSPVVWCGDSNAEAYAELAPMLDAGFRDALRETGGDAFDGTEESLFRALPTFSTTFPAETIGDPRPRRLDYILCRDARVLSATRVGDSPIPDATGTGRDGKLYPSDHLGVCATVQLSPPPT